MLVACDGPHLADLLAAAHAHDVPTVALQPDCTPRDPARFRDADVVLAPTRFAADYLREALGLPCAHLPPFVSYETVSRNSEGPGALAFDSLTPGHGWLPFAQIAEEIARRRPEIPLLVLVGPNQDELPKHDKVRSQVLYPPGEVWSSVGVLVAPMLGWEHLPLPLLSALRHGVPVVASNRGALPELLHNAALLLPVPDRLTPVIPRPIATSGTSTLDRNHLAALRRLVL